MSSFLIANQSVGLQKDLRPWLLPEDAYTDLENAFIFRGRTPKKKGAQALGPLSIIPVAVYPVLLTRIPAVPATLQAGMNQYNISVAIAGMNGVVPGSLSLIIGAQTAKEVKPPNGALTITGPDPIQININYATTIITIIVPVASPLIGSTVSVAAPSGVHTFPTTLAMRTPCMGIWVRQNPAINFEETVFFDQVNSYIYTPTGFQLLDPTTTWTGNNSDFFWCVNTRNPLAGDATAISANIFFATNFNIGDPIRYFINGPWIPFAPTIDATDSMFQARCIVNFKNRLLFFNTWEGNTAAGAAASMNYPNRLRFSWLGSPIDATAYRQTPPGKGGYRDAAIAEQIISVMVLKDCILVKFETVSWRVVYTGNPFEPFEWQKVNQEFGSESTFSSIQFDDYGLTVGNRAITKDSSVGVQRIDEKIPDEVFEINNDNNGPKRVWGIRDFPQEQVYWTMPIPSDSNPNPMFPNRILNLSYRTGAFGFFKDSFTALGRFQNQTTYTWGDYPYTWGDAPDTWGSAGLDLGFENIAAGNQQGNIFLLQKPVENDPTYEITLIAVDGMTGIVTVTLPNHNLDNGDFIKFTNVQGFNYAGLQVTPALEPATSSKTVNLPTTIPDDTLFGNVIPGSVTATLVQTVPAVTVNFVDTGGGTLVSDTAGFTGSIDYVADMAKFTFPNVPAAGTTTITVSYQYSEFNGRIFAVQGRTDTTFLLGKVNDLDEIVDVAVSTSMPLSPFTFGQLAYLTNFNITTKQFNPFAKDSKTLNMPYADLYLDGTKAGHIAIAIRTDDNLEMSNTPINTPEDAHVQWEISTVSDKPRFWTRVFTNSRGEFVQLTLYISNQEMMRGRSFNDFTLHGLMPYFLPSGRLIRTNYNV